MRSNKHDITEEHNSRRGGRFELFFFEQVGSRTYLRFTNLALFLILFLTIGAMAMILALFLWNSSHEPEETDVNVHVTTHEPTNYNGTVIQPPPPPPLPKVVRGPNSVPDLTNPLTTPTPAGNGNRMPTLSPSPSPTPGSSPVRTPT